MDTYMIQLALKRAGFDPGPLDGIFGPRTKEAVIAFQKADGLSPDGIVGPLTRSALARYLRGYSIHRIVRGDTFYRLAREYGTTVRAIVTANPGLDPKNLIPAQRVIIPYSFPVVTSEIPYTSALMGYIADGLRARYPFLRVTIPGRSVMGRPLWCFSIGSGGTEVFYNASHHANEWITTPLLMRFLEEYSFAYANKGRIGGVSANALYMRTTLHLIGMVNPDGVDLVNGAIPTDSEEYRNAQSISKNYPSVPFPSGWKANILGTDLNLNYPAGWEQAREIKFAQGYTSPAPRDYVGSSVLSEPESRTLYELTRRSNLALTLSYHTQGEIIFWKYLDIEPEGAFDIAEGFAAASGYAVSDTPYESGFAGYKDFFIQDYGRPGYTIEAGRGSNPLPLSQFPEIYSDNLGILILGLQSV